VIPILEVIASYGITPQKRGVEYWAICPFHDDKHPSLSVNADKGVFLCRSCGVGGDVVEFVKRIEGVDFKTAAKRLGVESYRPSPQQQRVKAEARAITMWAVATSRKVCNALREIGDETSVCKLARSKPYTDQKLLAQHEAALIRQWAILTDIDDDLRTPKLAIELWRLRADIDAFVEGLA